MKSIKTYILLFISLLLIFSFSPSHYRNAAPSAHPIQINDTIEETSEDDDTTEITVKIDTVTTKEKETDENETGEIQTEQQPLRTLKTKFVIPKTDHPLTKNISTPNKPIKGLENRHIALWQSHGLYYKQSKEKWMWQRTNFFETREDLFTQSFILPFLVPMLENAGATVLLPRERDTQRTELIVDNDKCSPACEFKTTTGNFLWHKGGGSGFANYKEKYVDGENPFKTGSFIQANTIQKGETESTVEWNFNVPKSGSYAVYISYKSLPGSCNEAVYTVHHAGGETQFAVNQTMGGGTWIYLGHFQFEKDQPLNSKVVLSNTSTDVNKLVTADAVKIGGGMGNISRKRSDLVTKKIIKIPLKKKKRKKRKYKIKTITNVQHFYNYSTSDMPRFTEGARYWLQWAGAPDSVYCRTNEENDYSDDFQSRGFWVNYLAGGSASCPTVKGLNIPIDLAFALHTDAGKTSDSIIGTLAIHTVKTKTGGTVYNNGISRWAARDLTDSVQTQVVNDIQRMYDKDWVRRQLWNRSYSESRVPEVPAMLLELLSHQNFPDMRYGQDPRFRFTASRAMYKGILRYLAATNGYKYVVQPLPVEAFCADFSDTTEVELRWKPVEDTVEITAKPTGYIVYTRIGNGGFNNGEYTNKNIFHKKIERNEIYGFKVEAVNDGGKSFPSEILSVCKMPNDSDIVLVVNAFNRISAPASFDFSDVSGFNNNWDAGVPYINDYKFTGNQTEFRKSRPYRSDENPGHGASNEGWEGKVIAGNTFDYPYLHGKSIRKAGYSFVSCSEKAVTDGDVNMYCYYAVDLILGKEREWTSLNKKSTKPVFRTFTPEMQKAIIQYTDSAGNLFVSGSNMISDLVLSKNKTYSDRDFVENTLKIKWQEDKINTIEKVEFSNSSLKQFPDFQLTFYSSPSDESYFVEAPDILVPNDSYAYQICNYGENKLGAGVAYNGNYRICALGFPFETIKKEDDQDKLMKSILNFFADKNRNIIRTKNNKTGNKKWKQKK